MKNSATNERAELHQGWEYNRDKVDEMVLALLHLTTVEQKGPFGALRYAWKSQDWDAMERLHKKGYISNPVSKNKSVSVTEEGAKLSEKLFYQHFGPAR